MGHLTNDTIGPFRASVTHLRGSMSGSHAFGPCTCQGECVFDLTACPVLGCDDFRDIKQLDFAKRHLQTTITALKRLHMLVSAVDQLSFMAKQHHYKEAANLVDAVRQVCGSADITSILLPMYTYNILYYTRESSYMSDCMHTHT